MNSPKVGSCLYKDRTINLAQSFLRAKARSRRARGGPQIPATNRMIQTDITIPVSGRKLLTGTLSKIMFCGQNVIPSYDVLSNSMMSIATLVQV